MDTSGAWADPALLALAAVAICWVAAAVQALAVVALGDDTPRRAGVARRPQRLLDLTGSVLVPSFTALGLGLALGWPGRPPVRPSALSPPRRLLVALCPTLAAGVVSGGAWALSLVVEGGGSRGVGTSAAGLEDGVVAVALQATTLAVLWLLPLPALPGGDLVALVLRGRAGARWARWHGGSGLLSIVVVVVVVALTGFPLRLGPTP